MAESAQPSRTDGECPVCQAPPGPTKRLGRWLLHGCADCGHRYLRETASTEAVVAQLYDAHYAGFEPDPVFRTVVRELIQQHFIHRIPPPASVLDVGCGNGEFLRAAHECGYTTVGIDGSAAAAQICRAGGLDAYAADFLTHPFEPTFSLVTLWDVVEHLPQPRAFVRRAIELLVPGGYLLVKAPYNSDVSVLIARAVPRLAAPVLQVPGHMQFFDRVSLAFLLRSEGFKELDWLESRRMRGESHAGGLRKRAARFVVSSVHRVAGDGNLFVMARKPLAD